MGAGIRCVTIVHRVDEIARYREFSAFFRLLGIFVCEKIEGMDEGDETDERICLLKDDSPECLENLIESLSEHFGISTREYLKEMADIFSKNDLMRGSYAIEYFAGVKSNIIYRDMLESHRRFKEAFVAFCELERTLEENKEYLALKYVLAAEANCQRRMNQLYTILWQAASNGNYLGDAAELKSDLLLRDYYFMKEIDIKLDQILKLDPNYYGAYAIRALAGMIDDDTRVDCMSDFLKAVSLIGNKSYTSYLRYRMGRYYEFILKRPEKSLVNYEKAYQVDPNNYRAAYKLAVRALVEKKDNTAFEWYGRIIEILGEKKDSKALQPVECAYLYKAYKNRGKIYLKQKMYEACLTEMKKAVSVYESTSNESEDGGFYPFMFNEHATEYKKAARDKLMIWKVYSLMSEAAARADLYDDYKRYQEKAEENRLALL